MNLPSTPIDMAGPWQAVAADTAGFVLDPHDEDDDMRECDVVTVVRRTAVPVEQSPDDPDDDVLRMPSYYHPGDILYRVDDLLDNPERVQAALAQAVATAEALNIRYGGFDQGAGAGEVEKFIDTANPPHLLRAELADLPAGLPAVLMLGTGLTLAGAYTGNVELIGTDTTPSTVVAQVMIPACSCPDSRNDVDPDCVRHYPRPPAEFLRLVALAITAGRGWEYGGIGAATPVEGVDERDVNAAHAVLSVLLHPGRNGVVK